MSTNSVQPWWVVIVAMSVIGMLTAMVIFTKSDNPIVSVAIAGLITLAGIVYGIQVRTTALEAITDGKTSS
jgi:hypothetical protein